MSGPQATLDNENDDPDEVEEPGVKILSKKEKERLKKEREKVGLSLISTLYSNLLIYYQHNVR